MHRKLPISAYTDANKAEQDKIYERLKKQRERPKPVMNVNTTIKPPPGKPPTNHLRKIEDDERQENFDFVEGFMRVDKTNQFWKASHREAEVTLPGKLQKISVRVTTLFDTGASGSNFVSRHLRK